MFFKPANIDIGELKVNNLDHLGAISFGTTKKMVRNVCAKKTQGFGQQMADYTLRGVNMHCVLDDDVVDLLSMKRNK
ncbi:MAG: hypothetical protein ACO1OC_11605 [Tuberibacillus sp.]